MGSSFNEEALKAQAIAAYSYIKYSNLRGITPTVSLRNTPNEKIKSAVRSVWGQAVYYNGSVAQTVYCASSGGATCDAGDVWGNPVPYLVSVTGDYDSLDPNYGRTATFTADEVRNYITSATGISLSDNPANWITVLSSCSGGYVGSVSIDGQRTVTGRYVRENIMKFNIRSAKFTVEYSNGMFTFTTYGYGHGVGMSQNGANLYANNAGYSYVDILKHYYSGCEVR